MRTIAITGSASGIGLATRNALEKEGARVIGVDLAGADIEADLSQPAPRKEAISQILSACNGTLDGFVPCAGISGTMHPGARIVGLNYFGTVEMLVALQPALARGSEPAAVAISSNSMSAVPNIPDDLVGACLSGNEPDATRFGDRNQVYAYAGSKIAVAQWVRRNAAGKLWAGAGITLNAIAPGRTRTAMDDAMLADENLRASIEAFPIPIGRPGRAEEIGDFVAFLLGDKGRFFCGSLLFIDGGTDALLRGEDWPVGKRA